LSVADAPQVGQIVDHHFLWVSQQATGETEGRKARPCLIIAVERRMDDAQPRVTVLAITSQAPRRGANAIAVPDDVRARIGLDRRRPAWIIIDEANVFTWPGFDLLPQPDGSFIRGVVTRGFFMAVRDAVMAQQARGRPRIVERDEE
jgi:hypothetical protein